ncbi:MAG: hypothetical protein FWH16_01480 [Oscillospiraceae bacterium]|nr:hypothetical protein [Oscillospiraceae bacterium]
MDHELFDKKLDAAAKELLTDAPAELLKGVMYRIEQDAKPKRRFAFGRYTGFAAAAAAVLIFVSLRSGMYRESNDTHENAIMPEAASAPVLQSAANADSMDVYDAGGGGRPEERALYPADSSAGAALSSPPELTGLDKALFEWTHAREGELLSTRILSRTDSELVAVVEYETEVLELTVIEREGEFSFYEAPVRQGEEPAS